MQLGLIVVDEWPFGKHKGKKMSELPSEYLAWVVFDSQIQGIPYKRAMQELDKREAILKGNGTIRQSLKDISHYPQDNGDDNGLVPEDMLEDW